MRAQPGGHLNGQKSAYCVGLGIKEIDMDRQVSTPSGWNKMQPRHGARGTHRMVGSRFIHSTHLSEGLLLARNVYKSTKQSSK